MANEQQALMVAYQRGVEALRELAPSDRLAVIAMLAGEVIAAAPDRNGRRQLLKVHDEAVAETVRQLRNGAGAS